MNTFKGPEGGSKAPSQFGIFFGHDVVLTANHFTAAADCGKGERVIHDFRGFCDLETRKAAMV